MRRMKFAPLYFFRSLHSGAGPLHSPSGSWWSGEHTAGRRQLRAGGQARADGVSHRLILASRCDHLTWPAWWCRRIR